MSGITDILASTAPARLDWTLAPGDTGYLEVEVRDLRGRLVPLDTVTSSVARVARVAGWATYVDLTVSVSSATTGATVGLVTVTATPSQAALLPSLGQWYLSLSGSSWTKTIVSGEFRHSGPTDPEVCWQVTCGCG